MKGERPKEELDGKHCRLLLSSEKASAKSLSCICPLQESWIRQYCILGSFFARSFCRISLGSWGNKSCYSSAVYSIAVFPKGELSGTLPWPSQSTPNTHLFMNWMWPHKWNVILPRRFWAGSRMRNLVKGRRTSSECSWVEERIIIDQQERHIWLCQGNSGLRGWCLDIFLDISKNPHALGKEEYIYAKPRQHRCFYKKWLFLTGTSLMRLFLFPSVPILFPYLSFLYQPWPWWTQKLSVMS